MDKTCYEIAQWMNNIDADGATDEEFAELFGLLDYVRTGRKIPQVYDADGMIVNMDVDGLCEHLKKVLKEIQGNVNMRVRSMETWR